MRFIHIADIHLGLEPSDGRDRRDLWNSLSQVFQIAEKQKIDVIFIAGDLFHRQPLMRELKEFNYLCSRLSHAKVVLIAGNHDYMHPNSNYRRFAFATNVIFLSGSEPEMVELEEYGACIYGFSYWQREIKESRYDDFRPKDIGKINILLGHGNGRGGLTIIRNLFCLAGHRIRSHTGSRLSPLQPLIQCPCHSHIPRCRIRLDKPLT